MKRWPKIENPIRNTVILLAVLGFCWASTIISATFFLLVASFTFSTIIIEAALKQTKKRIVAPRYAFNDDQSNQEKEAEAVRKQIDDFRARVGYTTNFSPSYTDSRTIRELPANKDNSRMPSSPPRLSMS